MASAMFSLADTDGPRSRPTRIRFTEGGSPEHQIPYLADFYLLTITQHQQLITSSTCCRTRTGRPRYSPTGWTSFARTPPCPT